MKEAERHRDALETLKSFNSAIVTIRLYPPMTPQVTNAVERGYKAVKLYLRHYGDFVISLQDKKPVLCGEPMSEQEVQSITNLVVFRQLELLGRHILVLMSGIDRHIFNQILFMFTARIEKIKQEGGGRDFAANLQLDRYFPDEYQFTEGLPEEAGQENPVDALQIPQLQEKFLSALFGEDQIEAVGDELKAMLADREKAVEVLAAGVAQVLLSVQHRKNLVASSVFPAMLATAEALMAEKDRQPVALATATLLVGGLREPGLTALLAQRYPEGFGTLFFEALVNLLDTEMFGRIVAILREQVSTSRLTGDRNPPLPLADETLTKLLHTGKGRHFLGLEKARSIMESGERERQAKRVRAGLQALLLGNLNGLQNDELVMGIPAAVQLLLTGGKNREASALLTILSDQLRDGDAVMQTRIIRSLALIGENLVAEGRWDLLAGIVESMLTWFRTSDTGDFISEKVANILQSHMAQTWKQGDIAGGDRILETFYQIRTGKLKKSPPVKALVDRVQDRGIDRSTLPQMLQECLDNPTNSLPGRRLVMLGGSAVPYLLDALLASERARDRIKIIDLLIYAGQTLPPLITQRLPEPMPWYCKRNLIKLLAETGWDEHVDNVVPFLTHEDQRVQREAFVCLYKISGKRRKEVLLRVVEEAPEILKPQAIKALIPFCDAEVALALGNLLGDQEHFSPDIRDQLLLQICDVLGRCPFPPATVALQQFLLMRGKWAGRKIGEEVWKAAEESLAQVETEQKNEKKRHVQINQLRKDAVRKVVQTAQKVPVEKKNITGLAEEQSARLFLDQGKVDSAKKQVLDLISRMARMRKFNQAEQLREWLIEIDSMALSDIIRAAEIIEREKRASIDREHIEVWSELYELLTTEEFSTLYHCLTHRHYENEEMIVAQGTIQTSLFFINSGKVKLFFRDEGSDVLVKTMVRGEVLGAGVFFDASVWTISAASLGSSDISILSMESLARWKNDYPAIESKLHDFCCSFDRIAEFFKITDKDRRKHKRSKLSGPVTAILLNNEGKGTGVSTKGELADISAGGVSFYIRISKKENSRMLLGRNVRVLFPASEMAGRMIEQQGVIMAVRGYHAMENEYSVHVKFDMEMYQHHLQLLLQLGKGGGRPGLKMP
jgi:hypothetical protein